AVGAVVRLQAVPGEGGWMAITAAVAALILQSAGFAGRRRGWDRLYATPCFVTSLVVAVGMLPYVLVECAPSPATHLLCAGALLLEAAVFLRMIAIFPGADCLYPVVGALAGAVYLAAFDGAPARRLPVAALAAAFILWGLGASALRVSR